MISNLKAFNLFAPTRFLYKILLGNSVLQHIVGICSTYSDLIHSHVKVRSKGLGSQALLKSSHMGLLCYVRNRIRATASIILITNLNVIFTLAVLLNLSIYAASKHLLSYLIIIINTVYSCEYIFLLIFGHVTC